MGTSFEKGVYGEIYVKENIPLTFKFTALRIGKVEIDLCNLENVEVMKNTM